CEGMEHTARVGEVDVYGPLGLDREVSRRERELARRDVDAGRAAFGRRSGPARVAQAHHRTHATVHHAAHAHGAMPRGVADPDPGTEAQDESEEYGTETRHDAPPFGGLRAATRSTIPHFDRSSSSISNPSARRCSTGSRSRLSPSSRHTNG